jgi:hypothetical protein
LRAGDEIQLGTVNLRSRKKRRWFGGGDTSLGGTATLATDQNEERPCWLLLLDVIGSTALAAKVSRGRLSEKCRSGSPDCGRTSRRTARSWRGR